LRAIARWPADAHRAWKNLSTPERVGLLEAMARLYGSAFSEAFLAATKGSTRLTAQHFVTALAHQTPQWFASRGYQLAQRSSYQEWWVHPDGHLIYLVLESTPKELKDALDRLLKAIVKADADLEAVSLMGLALDKFVPIPQYPKDPLAAFEEYLTKLGELEGFIDAEMAAAARDRAVLVKKGIGVTEFDAEVGRLADDQQRVKKRLEKEQLDELDPTKGDDDSSEPPPDPSSMPPPTDFSGGQGP
jgi:hypothetical protein